MMTGQSLLTLKPSIKPALKPESRITQEKVAMSHIQDDQSLEKALANIAKEITGVSARFIDKGEEIPPDLTLTPSVYLIEEKPGIWYCGESKHCNQQKTPT